MLLLSVALALADPSSSTHLAVCDSGGIAYLGELGPQGLKRVTWDGSSTQLDGLLAVSWRLDGKEDALGPVRLAGLEASFQFANHTPSDPAAHPGQQILLGPCKVKGTVYVDQPWKVVDALDGHKVQLLEPSQGKPVLEVDDKRHPLGTWWDETNANRAPREAIVQQLQWEARQLVVAPTRAAFQGGWLLVQLGEKSQVTRVETENSWD